jgi:8-oxo-dGTP pyrophosphatase MutT (NUDIX family)
VLHREMINNQLPMTKVKREFSAGGVVYKRENGKLFFLLGKHSGYHKWVLPKGLIEAGEKGIETAIRETEEEMGVKARLVNDKPIHNTTYFYWADLKKVKSQKSVPQRQVAEEATKVKSTIQNAKVDTNTRRVIKYQEQGGGKTKVFKTVTFYLLEYVAGDPKNHGWEMEEAGWFTAQEALERMSFEGEKEALGKAQQLLS